MSSSSDIPNQPGLVLRTAREELGYSIDRVAHELHLRASVVQAIENEDYSSFSSDVFLKGYFRSYCRLVNLHEERMVELLDKQLVHIKQECQEQADNVKKAAQAKVRKKIALLVALIAVIAGSAAYIFSVFGEKGAQNEVHDSGSRSEAFSQEHFGDGIQGKVDLQNEQVDSNANKETGASQQSNANLDTELLLKEGSLKEGAPQEQSQVKESVLDKDQSKELTANIYSTNTSTTQDLGEGVSAVKPHHLESTDLNTSGSASATEDAVSESEILIRFTGDCWLKFTNGDGKTVFAALKRAGQQVKYLGKAPFSIVLGDARQAGVVFNGSEVDLNPFTSKNGRAQFVLEP